MSVLRVFRYREFERQMQALSQTGGECQRIANRLKVILYDLANDGLAGLNLHRMTSHGESRLKHCVKYALSDSYRLVTVQNDGVCFLCYVGKHDDVDRWLDRNRGRTFQVDSTGKIDSVRVTLPGSRAEGADCDESDYATGRLLDRLGLGQFETLLAGASIYVMAAVAQLDTASSPRDIEDAVAQIADEGRKSALYDILYALRAGDVDEAFRRRELFMKQATLVENLSMAELVEIKDGETVKRVPTDSVEYREWIDRLMAAPMFHEWMLFTHPAQQAIVDEDYEGPARLSGVSGSGKTSIIVKRALRLARKFQGDDVLIVTLNRSLAALISRLVHFAEPEPDVRARVKVCAFFDLCREVLLELEPGNSRVFQEVTWKNEEHIDEIWREYYRCHANNQDASGLLGIHMSLNGRGVSAERYLREEMDWLRSSQLTSDRKAYLGQERRGRAIAFAPNWRSMVLEGLQGWERKMGFVGVTDQLGLAVRLVPYLRMLKPRFRAALVDEVQDFGTLELAILRALVESGSNDIFLCGDLAQRVYVKHQSLRESGIDLPPGRQRSITRNYRNGREVLRASQEVLRRAVGELERLEGEVELLVPEFSNFSRPRPLVLAAESPEIEIAAALEFAHQEAKEYDRRVCIAFAGYSLRDVTQFGRLIGLPVLDGTKGLDEHSVLLSDLEQTKGYEFDHIVIVNCRAGVLPATDLPEEEQFREACRLYVTMTRTKHQLLLSFSGEISPWLEGHEDVMDYDSWSEVVECDSLAPVGLPVRMPETEHGAARADMTGREVLYTRQALGLSPELQEKMDELIAGRTSRDSSGNVRAWPSLGAAVRDVDRLPAAKNAFGRKTFREFLEKFGDVVARAPGGTQIHK